MDVWKNNENFTHNIVLSFTGYQILDMVTFRELYAKLFDKLICYRDLLEGVIKLKTQLMIVRKLPTQVFWQWRVSKMSDFEEVKNYIKSKMESRNIVMNTTNKVWVLLLQMLDDILDRKGMKVWLDLWCCQGGLEISTHSLALNEAMRKPDACLWWQDSRLEGPQHRSSKMASGMWWRNT